MLAFGGSTFVPSDCRTAADCVTPFDELGRAHCAHHRVKLLTRSREIVPRATLPNMTVVGARTLEYKT
jgi:hypothetical protein